MQFRAQEIICKCLLCNAGTSIGLPIMIALFQEKRNIQNKQIAIVIIGLHFYLVEVENSESIYFHFETPF